MITGSIVSSMQGEPRATHDVDVLININPSVIPLLTSAFEPPQYYISKEAIEEAFAYKSMFNLLDTTEGDKVDFWILTDDAFDKSRFQRRQEEKLPGLNMNISTPEDTILMKMKWTQISGGSEKQFTDALRVYEVQYAALDFNYLDKWVAYLQVKDIWTRLKNESDPIL